MFLFFVYEYLSDWGLEAPCRRELNEAENIEALVPVIARTCYRIDEPGLRSAYSVRLRTGEARV